MARTAKTRHPKLDDAFAQYQNLLRHLAIETAKQYGGHSDDYIGTLLLRLNSALWTFKPEMGYKFTTYFMTRWRTHMVRTFVRFDAERQRAAERNFSRQTANTLRAPEKVLYAEVRAPGKNEVDGFLFDVKAYQCYDFKHVPGLFDDYLDLFDSGEEMWQWCMKHFDPRRICILERRYQDGLTLQEVGDLVGVTRERIRQIERNALNKLRDRLEALQASRAAEHQQRLLDRPISPQV